MLHPIITWYLQHKRDLPWRNTTNPYPIWLSEIILQQTRVEQGLPYYQKFLQHYPTVSDLALADDDDVFKLWQGLGYYNRAANMLRTARLIHHNLNGKFPDTYEGLIKLKGIGPYTAAAIASFAYNLPHAVLDGNVYRVLSRLFGIEEPINTHSAKGIFSNLANELLNTDHPALHNQAIMEFGALLCKPKSPDCGNCPVRISCVAYKNNKVNQLPVKIPKRKPVDRYFNYIIYTDTSGKIPIRQRVESGIWNKLYEFPLIESDADGTVQFIETHEKLNGVKIIGSPQQIFKTKHQLTHQTIYATFWELQLKQLPNWLKEGFIWVDKLDIQQYPVPRLLDRFIHAILL